jgi:hypothetical protein
MFNYEHFMHLKPPLAPNNYEIEIFDKYVNDIKLNGQFNNECLLLGFTKELLYLADKGIDLNPPPNSDTKIEKGDWFNVDSYYDIIIGDGCINMVGGNLVEHLSKFCGTLVLRFFVDKFPEMKYATQFRHNTPFLLPDTIIDTQPFCKILIWHFKNWKQENKIL